jgi:epoxyqueuosine reductase
MMSMMWAAAPADSARLKRTGRGRFLRNVMVAIGNLGQPELIGTAEAATRDVDPLVRGHAVWALSRLAGVARFRAKMRADPDAFVAEEWRLGLAEVSSRSRSRPPPSSGA